MTLEGLFLYKNVCTLKLKFGKITQNLKDAESKFS